MLVDPATFRTCTLDWAERDANRDQLDLHRDLLRLRTRDPVLGRARHRGTSDGAVLGA
jgi:maltooligosyltrehalose trehalohydrolase